MKISKDDIMDVVRSVVFALAIAVVLVIIAALLLQFTPMPDSAVMPINIVIKLLSLVGGTLLGIKCASRGALKGVVIGAFTLLFSYFIFSAINGSLSESGITYIDAITMIISAVVAGIIAVNVKGKSK